MNDVEEQIEEDIEGLEPEAQIETPPEEEGAAKPQISDEFTSVVKEFRDHLKETKAKESAPPARQPTQEEVNDFWAVYDPKKSNPNFYKKFFRLGEDATPEDYADAEATFKEMQSGIMKQAVTAAKNLLDQERQVYQQELAPIREHYTVAQAEKVRGRFYSSFPSFNETTHAKIIGVVAKSLPANLSEPDYFKALAEGAAEVIRGVDPTFALTTKSKPNPGTTPRLPRTSAGGPGGTGGGTNGSPSARSTRNDIDTL